ncbi:Ankyrin repeats (3 copies) [Rubripirellula tenax]|uniref:Ankyrin repeats (3 copies) n=1 Tax=Rubripirellula tenax TaxID=2528015 RepID=A0A5C6EMY2_9BACT|nr:ankyrin repeat domain-containing protein [Rubripirellula tenax]TWU50502.1 Ankyrin repeats (3 copies) [Rubripirellula tenax]
MNQTIFYQRRAVAFSVSLVVLLVAGGCGAAVESNASRDASTEVPSTDTASESEPFEDSEVSTSVAQSTVGSASVRYSDEAFRVAAHDGNIDIVRDALAAGTKVDAPDPDRKYTALLMAAYNGHSHVVKVLLENGAEVDARDFEGKTPLIHAASGPFPDAVAMLIDAGANINATETTEGFTALMTAAAMGEADVVKLLLVRGADPTVVDADNDTAKNHAINAGKSDVAELLP